jgi:hypothetical protein
MGCPYEGIYPTFAMNGAVAGKEVGFACNGLRFCDVVSGVHSLNGLWSRPEHDEPPSGRMSGPSNLALQIASMSMSP